MLRLEEYDGGDNRREKVKTFMRLDDIKNIGKNQKIAWPSLPPDWGQSSERGRE